MLILVADPIEWRGMRHLTHAIFPFVRRLPHTLNLRGLNHFSPSCCVFARNGSIRRHSKHSRRKWKCNTSETPLTCMGSYQPKLLDNFSFPRYNTSIRYVY